MHPLIDRIQQSIVTVFSAITLGFVLIHQLPTGPIQILFALYGRRQVGEWSTERIEQVSENIIGFSSNEPLLTQYLEYWNNILHLRLGQSVIFQEPVFEVLAPAIPWTVFLSLLAMLFNTVLGVSLGAYMAYREGSRFDVGSTFLSVGLSSIPYYIIAIFLLFFLGYQTGFFPTGQRFDQSLAPGFTLEFMLSALRHVALPFISLTFTSFAALGIRAHSIRILGSDYIRVARLRGLSERRIVFHYVLRNSILPYYTGFVLGLTGLFGGSVITERIFQYVGVGWYTFIAATGGDIPMVLGTFAFFTIAVVIALFVVDLTYVFIDPRAEGVGTDEAY